MVELGQLAGLTSCASEAAWSAALFDIGRTLGFDLVLYTAAPSKHASVETSFLKSNHPPAWRERYDARKFHLVDPVVQHCLGSALPIVWRPEMFATREQCALYQEASSFGIRSGISLPIHGCNGEFGLISFASDMAPGGEFDARLAHTMAELALVRDYAFESSLKFIKARSSTDPVPHLTRRELEVLKWVMAGKSSWEISRITDCAEATINFHISNIRQKFNVNTRQQALVKAIALGIISPEDHHR